VRQHTTAAAAAACATACRLLALRRLDDDPAGRYGTQEAAISVHATRLAAVAAAAEYVTGHVCGLKGVLVLPGAKVTQIDGFLVRRRRLAC
jgi:hypothetical protein